MSEPSREHIEAVGRGLLQGKPGRAWARVDAETDAAMLLTSTDPAVLDAMQDALVRAGRLRKGTSGRYITDWQGPDDA